MAIFQVLKRIALGNWNLPAQCTVALPDPQPEVSVWLAGRDVTHSHVLACAVPFTIGVCLDSDSEESEPVALEFRERNGQRRLLGEIGIRPVNTIPVGGRQLKLFEVRNCKNYCLPKPRLWAHYLFQEYLRLRGRTDPEVPVSRRGAHAMIVFFLCPRPVVLVSVVHGETGNLFPMNLMGPLGNGYFAFSLNSSRQAAPLVERAGKVALSNFANEQFPVARRLGKNHRREFVEWSKLPFETKKSAGLGLPVPYFAMRTRELEIETVRKLGSHTLFLARTVGEELWKQGPQCFMIHGIYKTWREKRGARTLACRVETRLDAWGHFSAPTGTPTQPHPQTTPNPSAQSYRQTDAE